MLEPALTWLRSLKDPFRNPNAAAQWIAGLPTTDAMALQKEALELVASFPGSRRVVGPAQAEALLRVDAQARACPRPACAAVRNELPEEHRRGDAAVARRLRSGQGVHRGVRRRAARGVSARRAQALAALLPWILVRLVHYRGHRRQIPALPLRHLDSRAMARISRALRIRARRAAGSANELAYGAGMFSRPGVCVEQEYLKTLLLMRLDSGNFTPDQVEWVARQLDGWAASLMLVPPPGCGRELLRRSDGVARACAGRTKRRPATACCCSTPARSTPRSSSACAGCPSATTKRRDQDDPPPREQRLLLMRLASLYGPDAIAQSPRATRFSTNADVRVVVGLAPLTRAIAEIERLPDNARTPGIAASYDEITDMVSPALGPETAMRRVRGVDLEDGGPQRHRMPAHGARQGGAGEARRDPRDQGRRRLGARRRAPDAAAPGRRDDRRHRDRRPPARARADAQLGDARRIPAGPAPTGRSSASTCRRTRRTARWRSGA